MNNQFLSAALCIGLTALTASLPSAVAGTSKPAPAIKSAPSANGNGEKLARSIEGNSKSPVNRTFSGRIDARDSELDDGSHYEMHFVSLSAGDSITVDMRSNEVDAYLMLYRIAGEDVEGLAEDDDSGTGTNARLAFTAERGGEYTIVANTAFADDFGDYSITASIIPLEAPSTGGANPVGSIAMNGSVNGTLDRDTDGILSDDTPFDLFVFSGERGQVVEVSMQSRAFDSYLLIADSDSDVIADNDDSNGTLNSRVRLTLPTTGNYYIIANCVSPQSYGSYTVSLDLIKQAQAGMEAADFVSMYPANGSPNGQYALLVGIDDYPGTKSDLGSCVTDVREMESLLINQFGFDPENIVVITDASATRDHIIAAFARHLGQAGPAGCAFFYYSGHGMQLNSDMLNQDEIDDNKDEALYVWGQDINSSVIIDDELGALMGNLRTDNKVAILDSCHSGTATLGLRTKSVSMEDAEVKEMLAMPNDFVAGSKYASDVNSIDHIEFAAARSDQLALAGQPGQPSVFTFALVREIKAAGADVSMANLIQAVRRTVRNYIENVMDIEHNQLPQLEGPNQARTLSSALGIRS